MIVYAKSESIEKPELVDTTSSRTTVYLRRNIVKQQRETEDGDSVEYYEYEEAKITPGEYEVLKKHMAVEDIRQMRADLDYIALMSGISLEEGDDE